MLHQQNQKGVIKVDKGTANPLRMGGVIPAFWNEIRVTKPPEIIQKILFGMLNPIGKLLGYRAV